MYVCMYVVGNGISKFSATNRNHMHVLEPEELSQGPYARAGKGVLPLIFVRLTFVGFRSIRQTCPPKAIGSRISGKPVGRGVDGGLSKTQLFLVRRSIKGLGIGLLRCDQARILNVAGITVGSEGISNR